MRIIDQLLPKNCYNERPLNCGIDTVIIHSFPVNDYDSTPLKKIDICYAILKNLKLSAHYCIDDTGDVYRFVEDQKRAWHAGKSIMPDNRMDVNNFSIGIELVTNEDNLYTSSHYSSLVFISKLVIKKYTINTNNILRHSDIAGQRAIGLGLRSIFDYKLDPLGNFEWDFFIDCLNDV